jgi:short-subunit dehydrogenase
MRKRKSGTIVNVTSLGGRIPIPLDPAYHATKFALEGLSESMQYEIRPFGIRIIVIEPGVVSTNFYGGSLKVAKMSTDPSNPSPYSQMLQGLEKAAGQMLKSSTPPTEVAKVIVSAVTSDNPDFRYIIGDDAVQILEAAKKISDKELRENIEKRFFGQSLEWIPAIQHIHDHLMKN